MQLVRERGSFIVYFSSRKCKCSNSNWGSSNNNPWDNHYIDNNNNSTKTLNEADDQGETGNDGGAYLSTRQCQRPSVHVQGQEEEISAHTSLCPENPIVTIAMTCQSYHHIWPGPCIKLQSPVSLINWLFNKVIAVKAKAMMYPNPEQCTSRL